MPIDLNSQLTQDVLVVILGLACGSFLNVLASRTLANESILWPPSHCPSCDTSIKWYDNFPIISYLILKGKCRSCKSKISIQYPLVEFFTAVIFIILFKTFGPTWQTAAMMAFTSTLIAITITDLREKLIPHDITYPSMLVGIAYSHFIRNDLLGTLAGIGVSYILFDFIAHYGLKYYLHFHKVPPVEAGEALSEADAENEEIEVMGGGDAVLSAVISAWLGWQKLLVALIIGFVVGTIMGVIYLAHEMRKHGIISQCLRPVLYVASLGIFIVAAILGAFQMAAGGLALSTPWLGSCALGAIAGGMLGFISVGSKVSKPFPFGPALAAGAMAAIFWTGGGIFQAGDR